MIHRLLLLLMLTLSFNQTHAAFNLKQFDNPEYAARYENLIYQMRCLVCQNQTIADSDADLAQDLRDEIFKMINSGKTDQQIIEFMVARYGEFVLYKPRVEKKTWLLWGGPMLLLFSGIIVLFRNAARRNKHVDMEIDQAALNKARLLLDEEDKP
ncbi:MAG TPA: cytochrome c-type biogenesis protein CcmH [Crenotrichaceae bacterium]|nr:cytochrome c-type biogenesis protein CcmH [Crenotrichaceae bacterium]